MRRHKLIAKALLVGAFCVAATAPAVPQQALNLDEARDMAFQLTAGGDYGAAAELARTLLKRDPKDHAALLALAQAQRGLGDTGGAVKTAKAAWRAAETPPQQYASATVVAQALAYDNKKLQSQLWLRRAAQAAPTEEFRDTAERNFKFIRSRTPLKVSLQFSVAPSSNVNNGSSSENTIINGLNFELSGEDQALSGIAYRIGATLNYNIPVSQRQTVTFGGSLDNRFYTLSSEAQEMAPDLDASELSFQQLTLHARTRVLDADNLGSFGAGLTIGQNWYGGSALTQFIRADANKQFAVGKTAQAGVGISVERRNRLDNDARSATIWSLSGNYAKSLENKDILSVNARVTDTNAAAASTAHQAARLALTYRFAKPIFAHNRLELSVAAEARHYDRPTALSPELREDLKLSASATMVMGDLDYFGFSPTATFTASDTDSNIDFYNSRNLGVSLGLRSSF